MFSYLSNNTILFPPTNYRRMIAVPSTRVGYTLWKYPDGSVLSIQPDGSEQTRSSGSDGIYEQSLTIGTRAIYDYDGMEVDPVVYDCIVT